MNKKLRQTEKWHKRLATLKETNARAVSLSGWQMPVSIHPDPLYCPSIGVVVPVSWPLSATLDQVCVRDKLEQHKLTVKRQ